jgi:hypothetical protein
LVAAPFASFVWPAIAAPRLARKLLVGRVEEAALQGLETALRVSPYDQFVWLWQHEMCHLHARLDQSEQAIE